jgi:cyclopropane-fatty-acyl-phospholipid synthase
MRALTVRFADRVAFRLPDGERADAGPAGRPTVASVTVHREAFFRKLARRGRMGLGESYVDGDWDADDLERVLEAGARGEAAARPGLFGRLAERFAPRRPENDRGGSRRHIEAHYDLGNEFFALWLDPSMTYSAAMFEGDADTMEAAQARKLETMAAKADIAPGHHVLEIGCGWGAFAIHVARTRGCRVTALTISPSQHAVAVARVRSAGLAHLVDVRLEDWRDTTGRFDRIVSIEMFEAVGRRWWEPWFEALDRLLVEGGRAAIQVICWNAPDFEGYARRRDWIETYVFPGSLLGHRPTFDRILAGHTSLRIVDGEDIGLSYAKTLARWRERFLARWSDVAALGFDARFRRLWEYYLAVCEAAFRAGRVSDLQLVLARPTEASPR